MTVIYEHYKPSTGGPGSKDLYLARYYGTTRRFYVEKQMAETYSTPTEVTRKFEGIEIDQIDTMEGDVKVVVVRRRYDETEVDREYNDYCDRKRRGRAEFTIKKPVDDDQLQLQAMQQLNGLTMDQLFLSPNDLELGPEDLDDL